MRRCTQCALVVLIVSLVFIWTLVTYLNWALSTAYVREVSAFQASVVSLAAQDLDARIHARMMTLTLVAEGIGSALIADPESLQIHFDKHPELLATFRHGVFVTPLDGTAIAGYPNDGRIGLYYRDEAYVAAALTQGKAGVSKPELGKTRSDLSFAMSVPIRNAQREVIGALSGMIDLHQPHFFKHRTVQADSIGDSLLHDPQHLRLVPASDKSGLMAALLVADDNPVLDRILNGDEATQHFTNLSGSAFMVSARRIPAADWLALVSWPTKDALAPIQDTVQRTQWVGGGLSLLALMLAGLMLRHQWSLVLSRSQLGRATDKLKLAHDELAYHREEMQEQETELAVVSVKLALYNDEKGKRADELALANVELAYQNSEKVKRSEELGLANVELAHQNSEKDKRAEELALANVELAHQNSEKDKRAEELALANVELAYQNSEKVKRAEELALANEELAYQNSEKDKRADELALANVELAHQNSEKDKRAEELALANVELAHQNSEKVKRAEELALANVELAHQNSEKDKRADELTLANVERTKEREEADKLSKLSFYDPLTNLPNRRLLSDRMTQMLASSRRTGRHLALMVLDLDNFKVLNDLHGHVMGDLLLVEIGQRLMACVREVDTVARFGGDEFVLLMGGLDVDIAQSTAQAREVAEKVRRSLERPYRLKRQSNQSEGAVIEHHCSVSIGVVVLVDRGSSHEGVIKLADAAMYQAKKAGRNMIRFHESSAQG